MEVAQEGMEVQEEAACSNVMTSFLTCKYSSTYIIQQLKIQQLNNLGT